MSEVAPGLYDRLITRGLDAQLAEAAAEYIVGRADLDAEEAHAYLAEHVGRQLATVLRGLPAKERREQQIRLANRVLEALFAEAGGDDDGELVSLEGQLLTAVVPNITPPAIPASPTIPLSRNDLLVNGRDEPTVGRVLARELESADRVDVVVAFIRWYGVRILLDGLRAARRRGVEVRVITTTYMGATEQHALEALIDLGADVRVSYETRTTRLHAKAWLFHRRTGYSTAYIGSSNLSKSALIDGLEWNVRLSEVQAPNVLAKFSATFESYWNADEFETYDPDRFRTAIGQAEQSAEPLDLATVDVRPYHYQAEILEALDVERQRHDRWRNLVVAPTGTGKTVVAALDYKRLAGTLEDDSLLFVAHRREILEQSRRTFRHVLRDGSFGELLVGGERPRDWRHVFASIQSLSALDETALPSDAFSVVIVDEFHHAPAPTYRALIDRLRPDVLLGLTATPERTDGQSVKVWFDDRFAFEMRLWDAIDEGLLVPFQYFGVADDVDLSTLTWSRGGYATADLERIYTGHDARTAKILQALTEVVADPRSMRALGFCVSVAHARYMATKFVDAGISAVAITGETPGDARVEAIRGLRSGAISVIFTVDLFSEGLDVPEIDTVLLLRPTESPTVFLQQLGRGLRHAPVKACLTVLDFIGQQHRQFRFDLRLRALTGRSRTQLQSDVAEEFPFLPAGCHIELDRQSEAVILGNLRQALGITRRTLAAELHMLLASHGADLGLASFLHEAGVELEDVYKPSVGGWSRLRREAGLTTPAEGDDEERVRKAIGARLLAVDDRERLETLALIAEGHDVNFTEVGHRERRLSAMLHFDLWGVRKGPSSLEEGLRRLRSCPALLDELRQLVPLLDDRAEHVQRPLDLLDVPLWIHANYNREEVLAAFGRLTPKDAFQHREGVWWDEQSGTDVFFITLKKSERDYSPTTMYEDYAISPTLFHWQSQSKTSQSSATGQRYLNQRELGTRVLLFVRSDKSGVIGAAPFFFLGPAQFVQAEGERPISITWQLDVPMPLDVYQRARVATA